MLATIFFSLFTTRYLIQGLGHSDFGLWGVIGGAIAFFSFLNPALSVATQRFLSYYEGKGENELKRKVFSISIFMHSAVAIVLVIILELMSIPLFSGILNIESGSESAAMVVYQCMIVCLVLTFISVPYDATINAHEDMKYYAIVGIIESVLKMLFALLLTVDFVTNKLEFYGFANIFVTTIVLIILRVYCKKNYKEAKFSFNYLDTNLLKDMGKFAFWNFIGTFTGIVGNYGSGLVTNHFFGTKINAALSVTGQLGGYLTTFSSNMLKAVNPVIVKNAGMGNSDQMLLYTLTSCKIAFLLFSFFAIPVLIETPIIIQLWLGSVPEWVVLFVRIYFIRVFFEQITGPIRTAVNANGRIAKMNIYISIIQLLSLPVMIYVFNNGFPPYWHLIIGMVFMAILPGIIQIISAVKYCSLDISYYLREIVIKCFITVIISITICILAHTIVHFSGLSQLIIISLINSIVFSILIYLISLSINEREIAFNIIKKTADIIKKHKQ